MAFTKVLGPGIHTQANIHSHNINSSGIITATKFVGPITGGGGDFNAGIVTCTTLDVNGNGDISGNLVLGGNLTVNGTTTTLDTNLIGVDRVEVTTAGTNVAVAVTHNGTGDLVRLYDGTSQKVTVDDEGKVGIGEDSPSSKFEIVSGNAASVVSGIKLKNDSTSASGPGSSIDFVVDGNNDVTTAQIIGQRTSANYHQGSLQFLTRDSVGAGLVERLRITSTGRVGINTTNPNAQLDVYKTGTGTVVDTIITRTSGGGAFAVQCSDVAASNPVWALRTYSAEDLVLSPGGHADANEKVRIKADTGNVGIATNDPQTLLHLKSSDPTLRIQRYNQSAYGDITADTAGKITFKSDPGDDANGDGFSFTVNNSEKVGISSEGNLKIATGGKLGINGAAPQSPLDVIANASGYAVDIRGRSSDDTSEIHFCGNNSSPNYAVVGVTTTGGGNLNVQVAGSQKLKIDNDGNITNTGIATSYVTTQFAANFAKLDLRGTNIGNSNHYILSYGEGHANDHQLHMVNTLGDIVFRTNPGTERLRITSAGITSSISPSDATPNFKWRSDDVNWHGYLNQTVHGSTISTILSCAGSWTVDGTTYNATKDYDGSFGTLAMAIHNQYNGGAGGFVFLNKDGGGGNGGGGVHELLRITSAGLVGIGTNSMDSSADVSITNASSSARVYMKSSNTADCSIIFGAMDDAATGAIRYDHSDDTLRLYGYNNTERLNISSTGVTTSYLGSGNSDSFNVQGHASQGRTTFNIIAGNADSASSTSIRLNRSNGNQPLQLFIGHASDDGNIMNSVQGGDLKFHTNESGSSLPKMVITSDGKVGVNLTNPQTTLNVKGTISAGRNVAREVGTVVDYSGQHSVTRSASNVINGKKNYENGSNDWLAPNGQRDDAYVTIDLQAQYNINRIVIYNQNEYNTSRREVKRFTLETSNDNATWTTVLDDECGKSNAHEPNPGWSFRIPGSYRDDVEFLNARYWKFTMKDFHGTDGYGGIMEIELYQEGGDGVVDEITSGSVVAGDVYAETGAFRRLTHNGAPNTGHDANGSNGVESGLSIGLDGNRTFLAIGMNGESNLPMIYKTYRINSPGDGISATHVLMEATSTTNSIVMNGTLTIFPGRAGYNQQRGYVQYAINLSAYSNSLYGFVKQLVRLDGSGNETTSTTAMEGYSEFKVVINGIKVQLEMTSSTAAVGRVMMIWQGQLLGHTHN